MTRISRDEMLMEVAQTVAKRGTCSRKQVGTVVARNGRVLVTGYNGAPAGMEHCIHETLSGAEVISSSLRSGGNPYGAPPGFMFESDELYHLTIWGPRVSITSRIETCLAAVHAEANAIAFAARYGIRLEGSEMFSTWTPCAPCAKLIINADVSRVVCLERYHDSTGANLLAEAGVEVVQLGE